ncbi:uncharacterized protein LOC133306680 [Gastrolobium bilobum]|uniref:uncharacterized protein LOC133306680 n=1 Tax=Gastrolobium bilobum TaxID=150636 RepID=UPI002AB16044|nr:uncharacterized protein LOC133306680 [Gastrolobium bilobum]
MAGLQQYNFFPTDLFYPRPKPQTSSVKPTVLPLQTPNVEDVHPQTQHQQQQPHRSMIKATPSSSSSSSSAVVYSQKRQSQSLGGVKVSKFSPNPLSWVVWMTEDEE